MSEATTDDQLQEFLEGGGDLRVDPALFSPQDVQVYQLIFERLGQEPDVAVPLQFPETVVRRIRRATVAKHVLLYVGIAVFTVVATAAIYFLFEVVDKESAAVFGTFIGHNKWMILYLLALVLVMQRLDRSRGSIFGAARKGWQRQGIATDNNSI